ncbi:sensor histidine kinase [Actinomadura violacea]|uniref:Sensor histidine kinase n=1 Tax=Actinomadura violacea TaxID=2819934 RepID=A0ABS3S3B7_9ACTN|nr:sensor histidine kinase [Actinomadura violacea]MBO2463485.1 sensor histidine kinase [Actinomadura violacea]
MIASVLSAFAKSSLYWGGGAGQFAEVLDRLLVATGVGEVDRMVVQTPDLAVETLAGLTVGASPEIVERILAPLLDNARPHAATTVVVRLEPGVVEPGVRIVIHDDGAGVPESALRARVPGRAR